MKRSLSRLQPLRRVAALVLASLLAACSLTPDHVRPAPPVAPAWVDAGSATGTPAADLDWADFLTDERIRALVRLALQNNRDLRIAVLNVEQVRALYGVQRADPLYAPIQSMQDPQYRQGAHFLPLDGQWAYESITDSNGRVMSASIEEIREASGEREGPAVDHTGGLQVAAVGPQGREGLLAQNPRQRRPHLVEGRDIIDDHARAAVGTGIGH